MTVVAPRSRGQRTESLAWLFVAGSCRVPADAMRVARYRCPAGSGYALDG